MLGYSNMSQTRTPFKSCENSLQATACQTNGFNEETKTYGSTFFQSSPQNFKQKKKLKASRALEKAHTLIDTLVSDVQSKKAVNQSAVRTIHGTNQNILRDYHVWLDHEMTQVSRPQMKSNKKVSYKEQRTETVQSTDREQWIEVHGQDWKHESAQDKYSHHMERSTTQVYEDEDEQEQNSHFRDIIEQQQESNMILSKRCEMLSAQNSILKSQVQSTKKGTEMSQSRWNNVNESLWRQFQELKKQNYQLKQDTIRLLKSIR